MAVNGAGMEGMIPENIGVTREDDVVAFDIPIFTEEFLDHNKS